MAEEAKHTPEKDGRRRGWRYWIGDMQDCAEGDHGDWWAERFEQSVTDHAAGLHDGSWQVWRDIRLTEREPVFRPASTGGES